MSDDNTSKMVEAKDYTDRNAKVGRGDLQKLGGALGDVDVDSGAFFSATEYTGPARKYAAASEKINDKPISLFHLRPSTVTDKEGRILEVHVHIHIATPIYEKAAYQPVFSDDGHKTLDLIMAERQLEQLAIAASFDEILDSKGEFLEKVTEITRVELNRDEDNIAHVSFVTHGGHIYIEDRLVGIRGFTGTIPYVEDVEEIVIKSNGEAKVYIATDDKKTVNTLLTDLDLKRVVFAENREIQLKPKNTSQK